jgi:arginine utilization regulatory protein
MNLYSCPKFVTTQTRDKRFFVKNYLQPEKTRFKMGKKNSDENWLMEHFKYVDSITIVDKNGKIIAQHRYNPRFSKEINQKENKWSLNKNILEVLPSIDPEESTLLRVLKTGKVVYQDEQVMWDHEGRKLKSTNINFPILSRGKIIGAVELSRDTTHIESEPVKSEKIGIDFTESFEAHKARYCLEDIIAVSQKMLAIKDKIKTIAHSVSSVLVYGDTGTGKELIVQAIHNESYRKYQPFIPINCASVPESLFEGILFGSSKGAFTGAIDRKGIFEAANKGTLYLDEINSMPTNLQAKLLRAIQEKEILPLGKLKPVSINVRVIASTNTEPKEAIKNGELREDLYYRLNAISFEIPSLKQRFEDIPLLVSHFIDKYNQLLDKSIKSVSNDVLSLFLSHDWPGNVRELEHIIESAINVASEVVIHKSHMPIYLNVPKTSVLTNIPLKNEERPLKETMAKVEKNIILEVFKKANNNMAKAARMLQIPRSTLQYKIERYKISK